MIRNAGITETSIRLYKESDLSNLEQLNMFAVLQIKYHGGVKSENVFCAIENNSIIGAGILTLFHGNNAELSVYSDSVTVEELLFKRLIERFHELQKENDCKMVLRACYNSDEIAEIQFLLNNGFQSDNVIMWLKYDLSRSIVHYSIPEDIEIKALELSGESTQKYLKAAVEAGFQPMKDPADISFRTGAPGFTCYVALTNGEIIGSVTIFDTSEGCGATEFIFVSPSNRRSNIARELIATALAELKKRGKKEASLTVFGTNTTAMNLYLSMGYHLVGTIIELKKS